MIIERTNNEIIFRLPGNFNIDELQDLKDWFEYLYATQNSKANQDDVNALVKEIKKGRWNKRKIELMK
jgi:hypothetical protein